MAFHDNWPDDQTRRLVIQAMIPGAKVMIAEKDGCPHSPALGLENDDGKQLSIVLDQGFGAWRTMGRCIEFDGSKEPERHAEAIRKIHTDVELQGNGRFPSPLVLKC